MAKKIRSATLASTLALSLLLTGCFGDDGNGNGGPIGGAPTPTPAPAPAPTPSPSPSPTPSPTAASFNVTPCLNQTVVPGRTLANLAVPDVIRLDLTQPAGFPNGRRYLDPVIDVTLAALFLDLRVHSVTTFASIPVNPNGVDQPLTANFPFLAPPFGNPPTSGGAGSRFLFRDDPASAYTRLDRMGMPAVATALIFPSARKDEYNDDNPAIDASGKYVPTIVEQLTFLTNALADDFQRLGLTLCATPT